MIMYSKVTKVQVNQQKQLQVTEMKITLFRCYNTISLFHYSWPTPPARKAGAVYHWRWVYMTQCSKIQIGQEGIVYILDVEYIWFSASEIKC